MIRNVVIAGPQIQVAVGFERSEGFSSLLEACGLGTVRLQGEALHPRFSHLLTPLVPAGAQVSP